MKNLLKYTMKCQFCGEEVERTNTQKVATCFECRRKRDRAVTLKRWHLKNPNAKYKKHDTN